MVAAVDCGGGDGRLCVAVVVTVVKFSLVRTWYPVIESFCADAHRLTMNAISRGYYSNIFAQL